MTLFLQLYAVHLIAHFIVQPRWSLAAGRGRGAWLKQGFAYFALAGLLVNVGLDWKVLSAIFALAAVHVLIEILGQWSHRNDPSTLVATQLAHLAVVTLAAILAGDTRWTAIASQARHVLTTGKFYLLLSAYLWAVPGSGVLVRGLTEPFLKELEKTAPGARPGLPAAGRLIGYVERTLVLSMILAGLSEAIGFILAIKALARFPEIRENGKGQFAEYFLLGSLTSVGFALVVGIVVRMALGLFEGS
jgi:hypothetical protein